MNFDVESISQLQKEAQRSRKFSQGLFTFMAYFKLADILY
jgi:hypothetical protein